MSLCMVPLAHALVFQKGGELSVDVRNLPSQPVFEEIQGARGQARFVGHDLLIEFEHSLGQALMFGAVRRPIRVAAAAQDLLLGGKVELGMAGGVVENFAGGRLPPALHQCLVEPIDKVRKLLGLREAAPTVRTFIRDRTPGYSVCYDPGGARSSSGF